MGRLENEGVSPDIEVVDLPELLREGRDPSLERAGQGCFHRNKRRAASYEQ